LTGDKIGAYRVLKVLGEGGMGRVVLAEHVLMKTKHAVKVLHDQLSKSDMIVQRFINEARAAGAIGHRNVVEITHVDQVQPGGSWYLVMKYLEGGTLAAFLASRSAPLDQRTILHIVAEALNGLQAAHDRRIIHRDLKPDNLYLTTAKDDPYRTILLDFGVAQLGHDPGVVTRTGALIGTPQYMAPEQHRGAKIDDKTDLWSMGAILYEMVTGRLPYQDEVADRGSLTGAEIFHRMMSRQIVDPRRYNAAITPAFASAIVTALQVDPARRPASARALALLLASATPRDGHGPSGTDILRAYADELLEASTVAAVVPSQPAVVDMRVAGSDAPAFTAMLGEAPLAHAAVTARLSTLGATAGQSVSWGPHRGSRWRWLAVGLPVAVAAIIGVALLTDHGSSRGPAVQGDALASVVPTPTPPAYRANDAVAAKQPEGAPRVGPDDAGTTGKMPDRSVPGATTGQAADPPPMMRSDGSADARVDVPSRHVAEPSATAQDSHAVAPASGSAGGVRASDAPRPAAPESARARTIAVSGASRASAASGAAASGVSGPIRRDGTDGGGVRTEPASTGGIKIVVLPWAEVWIDGKPMGQTPLRIALPVGPHRVRLKNDTKEKTINVAVTSSRFAVIDETW
jgi:tRNA A-37 threonylcarbamoyl transferase component Bud32